MSEKGLDDVKPRIGKPIEMGSNEVNNGLNITKYNGENFAVRKIKIQAYLKAKGWFEVLEKREPAAADLKVVYREKDAQAYSVLLNAMTDKQARLVLSCKNSYELWEKLNANHDTRSGSNQVLLQQQFFDLVMRPKETVTEYVGRGEYLKSQLEDAGVIAVDDKALVMRLVTGLTPKYRHFKTYWMNQHGRTGSVKDLCCG